MVVVIGVLLTLALQRLAPLQQLGQEAGLATVQAQQRAAAALAQARCPAASNLVPVPAASSAAARHLCS